MQNKRNKFQERQKKKSIDFLLFGHDNCSLNMFNIPNYLPIACSYCHSIRVSSHKHKHKHTHTNSNTSTIYIQNSQWKLRILAVVHIPHNQMKHTKNYVQLSSGVIFVSFTNRLQCSYSVFGAASLLMHLLYTCSTFQFVRVQCFVCCNKTNFVTQLIDFVVCAKSYLNIKTDMLNF